MRSTSEVLAGARPWAFLEADSIEAMAALPENSVDAVVTDPPYGLEFMGKEWDRLDIDLPQENVWKGRRGKGGSHIGDDDSKPASRHRVQFGANRSRFRRCTGCGKREFSGSPCRCLEPTWIYETPEGPPSGAIRMQLWHEAWARAALRVLKPGGHLIAFGGTRTSHRLACALEDAGFEIRDMLMWLYASGFPKSLDVSKAIDTAAGAERETVGEGPFASRRPRADHEIQGVTFADDVYVRPAGHMLTTPTTDAARAWAGWGTALKPGWEPVILCRKPLSEPTVGANGLRWGTGALNIDATRTVVPGGSPAEKRRETARRTGNAPVHERSAAEAQVEGKIEDRVDPETYMTAHPGERIGRWPPNLLFQHSAGCERVGMQKVSGSRIEKPCPEPEIQGHKWGTLQGNRGPRGHGDPETGLETVEVWRCMEGCPVRMLDAQGGERKTSRLVFKRRSGAEVEGNTSAAYGAESRPQGTECISYGDVGGASRFFPQFGWEEDDPAAVRFLYCPKADRAEREVGLGSAFPKRPLRWSSGEQNPGSFQAAKTEKQARNFHPTVKPVTLMRWLCRLVTPPRGVVLDPFMGSGSTGIAALREGFRFLGIEREAEYCRIARARIVGDAPLLNAEPGVD